MRSRTIVRLGIYAALFVALQGAQCPQIPEMKDVEISVVAEDYVELEFQARGSINWHSDTETIDIDDLRQQLEDADVDVAAVDTIVVSAVLYGVTAYNEAVNDRQILDGMLTITRTDDESSADLFEDVDIDIYPLLGELVPAPIESGGIDFINDLLADVLVALQGSGPSSFSVYGNVSGTSSPQGRDTNFDWRVRIYYQVVGRMTTEVIDL